METGHAFNTQLEPTSAFKTLDEQMLMVEDLLSLHDQSHPSGRGRRTREQSRQNRAVSLSAVMLISAAFQAYVEDLFDEYHDSLFAGFSEEYRQRSKKETSGKMNNAGCEQVNKLFSNVDIGASRDTYILSDERVHWPCFSNAAVKDKLDTMICTRNVIAHGRYLEVDRTPKDERKKVDRKCAHVSVNLVRRWCSFTRRLATKLDIIILDKLGVDVSSAG